MGKHPLIGPFNTAPNYPEFEVSNGSMIFRQRTFYHIKMIRPKTPDLSYLVVFSNSFDPIENTERHLRDPNHLKEPANVPIK